MKKRLNHPRGSLLVACLVVLFLVVMMSFQTFQTLLLARRSDSRQNALLQARELVELGRIMHRQNPEQTEFEPAELSLGEDSTGLISITIKEMAAEANTQAAEDTRESATSDDAQAVRDTIPTWYRVVAAFPAGTSGEVMATWEGHD